MNDQTPLNRSDGKPMDAEPMKTLAQKYGAVQADPASLERKRQWQEENAAAIDSSNAWVRKNGLPLAKYRPF